MEEDILDTQEHLETRDDGERNFEILAPENHTHNDKADKADLSISSNASGTTINLKPGTSVTLKPVATSGNYNDLEGVPGTATTSIDGLMSYSDKAKLDGIATGAEVNQNAFSSVKVGATTIAADSKTDTLELVAGSNITLTPDATNDKVTIAATDTTYSAVVAGSQTPGLMTGADKSKLDGITAGAEVNVQADWNQTTTTADDFIKNKPTIPATADDVGALPAIPYGEGEGYQVDSHVEFYGNIGTTGIEATDGTIGGIDLANGTVSADTVEAQYVNVSSDGSLFVGSPNDAYYTEITAGNIDTTNISAIGIYYPGSLDHRILIPDTSGSDDDETMALVSDIPTAGTTLPQMDSGSGSAGGVNTTTYSKSDHVHPTDTSRASVADATLTARTGKTDWILTSEDSTTGYTIEASSTAWQLKSGSTSVGSPKGNADSVVLTWTATEWGGQHDLYAVRVDKDGYILGSNSNSPLANAESIEQIDAALTEALDGQSSGTVADLTELISSKADKVTSFTQGNFASIGADGSFVDSGHKHSDYLTSHQDISGKADKSEMSIVEGAGTATITLKNGTSATVLTQHQDISGKADKSEMGITTSADTATITLKSGTSATVLTQHQTLTPANDGVLTIQQNGRTIDTFSANSAANKTVNIKGVYYATCTTAEATKDKVATLVDVNQTFTLEAGVVVCVNFTYRNWVYDPTLSVAGTAAKQIRTGASNSQPTLDAWKPGLVTFVYDGTYWQMDGTCSARASDNDYGLVRKTSTAFGIDDYALSVAGANTMFGNIVATKWVQTSAYSVGDYVTKEGRLYRAKVSIAANTAWNANNWEAVTAMGETQQALGEKLDKEGAITILSLESDDAAGLVVGDTAEMFHASYQTNRIVHNFGVNGANETEYALNFPPVNDTLATKSDTTITVGGWIITLPALTTDQKEALSEKSGISDNEYAYSINSANTTFYIGSYAAFGVLVSADGRKLVFEGGGDADVVSQLGLQSGDIVAKATYVIGDQTDKPLQPAGDYLLEGELPEQTIYQGTCSTAAGTAAKVVTLNGVNADQFEAKNGVRIFVSFTVANTSTGTITLNVNGTGAGTVFWDGANTSSSNRFLWAANARIQFQCYVNASDTIYWMPVDLQESWYGECGTGAGTQQKSFTVNGFVFAKNTRLTVKFTTSHTHGSGATLNVSGTGAHYIYADANNQITSASAYKWAANDSVTFINQGNAWRLDGVNILHKANTAVSQSSAAQTAATNAAADANTAQNSATQALNALSAAQADAATALQTANEAEAAVQALSQGLTEIERLRANNLLKVVTLTGWNNGELEIAPVNYEASIFKVVVPSESTTASMTWDWSGYTGPVDCLYAFEMDVIIPGGCTLTWPTVTWVGQPDYDDTQSCVVQCAFRYDPSDGTVLGNCWNVKEP